jgi:hypothetical protein
VFGHTRQGSSSGPAGRVVGTLFFGAFAAAGLFFGAFLIRQVYDGARTYAWTRVDCLVLAGGVEAAVSEREQPYRFVVTYAYTIEGVPYRSSRVASDYAGARDYGEAARLARRFPPGATATCLVNPSAPSEAMLERSSMLGTAIFIVLPAIFVAIGFGGIYAMWFGSEPPTVEPISARAKRRDGSYVLAAFASIFLVVGLALTYPTVVVPISRMIAARGWTETPATVVSSRVLRDDSGEDTTYVPDVLYAYTAGGEEFRSNAIGFFQFVSTGTGGAREVVASYPSGRRLTAYVDPDDPTRAVLERGPGWGALVGLIPLAFAGAGGAGLAYSVRAIRRKRTVRDSERTSLALRTGARSWTDSQGPVTLATRHSRGAKLAGMAVFALFWNGISWPLFLMMFGEWQRGRGCLPAVALLGLFVLIGAAAAYGAVHQFAALFSPRPELVVSSSRVPLGGAVDLRWRLRGGSVSNLRIALEGREEATYTVGTSTSTDKHVFASFPLVESRTGPGDGWADVRVRIPSDTMHTFESDHNKVAWALRVTASVAGLPDIDEEYEVEVTPHARGGATWAR